MFNDLLDLARLESGQTPQRLEVVSPRTLIDDPLPNLLSLAEAHDLRLVAGVAPDLPEVAVEIPSPWRSPLVRGFSRSHPI